MYANNGIMLLSPAYIATNGECESSYRQISQQEVTRHALKLSTLNITVKERSLQTYLEAQTKDVDVV